MNLSGKTALVTGGSRGIGRAVATSLLDAGATVMICARLEEGMVEAVKSLGNGRGDRIAGVVCDVSNEAAIRGLMTKVTERFGGLDILINNAGVGLLGNVEDMSPDDWRQTIDVNLSGTFYCCHYAIPEMKKRSGGDIVNMASRSSVNAFAGGAAYCASKFGLLGFSESLNLEVCHDNIRVSCILPGRVSTDFAGETPQDWHLTPEDVAKSVIAILSFPRRVLGSRIELRPFRPSY
jgi:NAD(P)-dependent dehydrogenase (short-subunit alcohol dehydrogenase family)